MAGFSGVHLHCFALHYHQCSQSAVGPTRIRFQCTHGKQAGPARGDTTKSFFRTGEGDGFPLYTLGAGYRFGHGRDNGLKHV